MTVRLPASKPSSGAGPTPSTSIESSRGCQAATSKNSRSDTDDLVLKLAQTNAEAGEYWLIRRRDRDPWPGVLCDEEMVSKFFKVERPLNAKQPNGSFTKHFLPHGKYAGQKSFPFLLLDSLKVGYIPWHRLQAMDLHKINLKVQDPSIEPALKRAYTEAIFEHDLDFWKDALYAKSLSEQEDDAESTESHIREHKRTRGTPSPQKSRRVFELNDEEDDDEEEYIKKEPEVENGRSTYSRGYLDQDHSILYEGSDSESRISRVQSKKIKISRSMSRFTPPTTPQKRKAKMASNMVRVYVGNPHQNFVVKRAGLEESVVLRGMVKYQDNEAYVMSPVLSELQAPDFTSVAEYLDHAEYKPNLLDEGTDYARLEGVETAPQHFEAICQCGSLYTMADKLDLPGLKDLTVRKFRALVPYTAEAFILMAKLFYCFGCPSDDGLHEFMVTYATDHFYELLEAEAVSFVELLKRHPSLAKAVFRTLGGVDMKEQEKAKKEEEEEDEGQEERKEEHDDKRRTVAVTGSNPDVKPEDTLFVV